VPERKAFDVLNANIVKQAVAWCALPFPQYSLPDDEDDVDGGHRTPGHGAARVEINFWFFLFVYYGFYNLTALMWVTKVFNIYSLNWYDLPPPPKLFLSK